MTNAERISANNAELRVAISMAESISGGSGGVIEPLSITKNGTYTAPEGVDGYSPIEVAVPMPEGTLEITANGIYPVAQYAEVDVSVPAPEGDTLTEFLRVRNGSNLFYEQSNLTEIPMFDASVVTTMNGMCFSCQKLTTVPLLDTRNVTDMSSMFSSCRALTTVPLFNTSKVTNMFQVFYGCSKLTTVPLFNTHKVTSATGMFYNCSALTTVPAFDLRAASSNSLNNFVYNCSSLTEIWIRNIRAKLTVSDGTSYGHLLTVDSLVHLIYELRKHYSSLTLTVGSANLEKLANVYVKAIDITDEMRAEDDLIDEKYPFVVCESTDEGAMLITTYASTIKNWTIK